MPAAARPGARGGDLGEGAGGGSSRSPRERRRLAPRHAALPCRRCPVCGRWRGRGGRGAGGGGTGSEDPDAPSGSQPVAAAHSHTHTGCRHPAPGSRRRDARGQVTTQWHTRSWRHTGTLVRGHTHAGTHTHIHCHMLIVYSDTPSHTHWYTLVNTFLRTVMLSHTGHTPAHVSPTTPSCWHTLIHTYPVTCTPCNKHSETYPHTLVLAQSSQHRVCQTPPARTPTDPSDKCPSPPTGALWSQAS